MENVYVPMRILSPNECPNCGNKSLYLVDMDINVSRINNNGQLSESKDGCQFFIRCSKCGKHFDAVKKGNFARIQNNIFNESHLLANPFYQK